MTRASFKCPECAKTASVADVRRFRAGTLVKRRWKCECGSDIFELVLVLGRLRRGATRSRVG